jgi:hypothetical protein
MTTEQTEDEFTKKRRLAAQTAELGYAVTGVRNLLEEIREAFPRETEFLRDEAMVDAMSSLLDLLGVILGPTPDHASSARRLIGMMEGDPTFVGVVAKMESALDRLSAVPSGTIGSLPPWATPAPTPQQPPSWATIQRLFKENPSPLPDQAPAIACGVMLRGVPMTLEGALSETPEGGLRLLSRGAAIPGGGVSMVEQFFDYEDVMVVAVQRKVTVDAPRIIQSS